VLIAVEQADINRQDTWLKPRRVLGNHDDGLNALGLELGRDLLHRKRPVDGLSAGHGDGVVVEDLVGYGGTGGDSCTDRKQAGVIIGAISEIDEHMTGFGERCLAQPGHTFTPHLTITFSGTPAGSLATHPLGHDMAADSGHCPAALRYACRAAMRTARAKMRWPRA